MTVLARPEQHLTFRSPARNDTKNNIKSFDNWLKDGTGKRSSIIVIPMLNHPKERRHSYAIYEYEYIQLAKDFG